MALAIPLPSLTDADPTIAGEGSLDPLGLAQIADRLADMLVPGVRARMRRVRFVTAATVGALAAQGLQDLIPSDGVSNPSICFEWLVLESFARKDKDERVLETAGIPGSSKARNVIALGKRLNARNYLKSPGVFGFTGVYLPLARSLHLLTDDRQPSSGAPELVSAWERDQDLAGFVDDVPGSPGGVLRSRLGKEIERALITGHASVDATSHLYARLTKLFHPTKAGRAERQLLRGWLVADDEPRRAEVARSLTGKTEAPEPELLGHLDESGPSVELSVRIEAIKAYERVASLLDAAFRELRYVSTQRGTKALTPQSVTADAVLSVVANELPAAMSSTAERLEALGEGLPVLFTDRLGKFESRMSVTDFVETLMTHHEQVQQRKLPRGKRPWFERYNDGWVIRSLYANQGAVDLASLGFVHPYRLIPVRNFMEDLQP